MPNNKHLVRQKKNKHLVKTNLIYTPPTPTPQKKKEAKMIILFIIFKVALLFYFQLYLLINLVYITKTLHQYK
jgi:hypothetical protein